MLFPALAILTLAQLAAPPLSPPGASATPAPAVPVAAPTVQTVVQPTIAPAPAAGLSTEAYVVTTVLTAVGVVFGGGAFWSYRQNVKLKAMDVKAEAEKQASAELARFYADDRGEKKWLRDKCDEQDRRLTALDAKCETIREERHDCREKLDAAGHKILRLEGENANLGTQLGQCQHAFKALKAIHDRCPRPQAKTG